MKPRLPKELLDELVGVDWQLVPGHGHLKLFVDGRLAGPISANPDTTDKRPTLNIRSNIRKIVKRGERK